MRTIKSYLLLMPLCATAFAVQAQSAAITYRGRLAANGAPFSGFAEMQFTLFDAPTGGAPVAISSPGIAGVNVSGGQFTVPLDFGAGAFPGADRFLEIQVRTNLGPFSTLTPRQQLTPTPYALYAQKAGTAAGPWVQSGNDLIYTAGKVGVGTGTPGAGLHVKKEPNPPGGTLALEGDTHAYMTFFPDGVAAGRRGFFGFASSNATDLAIANEYPGGRIVMLDRSGTVFPTASGENLRIVRGGVSMDVGATNIRITSGGGFSVEQIDTYVFRITFDVPFTGTPTITVTVRDIPSDGLFHKWAETSNVGPSGAQITMFSQRDDGPSPADFDFIAVGPR